VGDDPIAALWAAGSVAVVGASQRSGAPGRLVLEHLGRHGYRGRVVAVNPRATEAILGFETCPAVPAGIDLAMIVVPAPAVAGAVGDCAAAGIRCAIVGSSGFAETGAAGRAAQEELVTAARAKGMRLVGPNCIGSVGFGSGLVASFSPLFSGARTRLLHGGVGFASASGALGYGAVSLALERGLGLYAAVTTGNESDVTALEALAAMAREPGCTAVLGYLESLADIEGLRALAATGKPAALLVAGRTAAGARAAASHTGALATPDRLVTGVLRQYGIVRARDVDELLDIGEAFAAGGAESPAAKDGTAARVGVITTSGGSGILAADAVAEHGLALADLAPSTVDALALVVPPYGATANPVDVTASVMSDRTLVARCVDLMAADPGVDALVVCFCVLTGADVAAIGDALATARTRHGKPILVARTGAAHLAPDARDTLRAAGIPEFPTPARAVRALAALAAIDSRAVSPRREPTAVPEREPTAALARKPTAVPVTEAGLKALLAARGLRVPRGRLIHAAPEAADAVRAVGGRAVLKVVVPGVVHKTELGGVRLGVSAADAEAVAAHLLAIPGAAAVLVEEEVTGGVEVLVGVAPTPLGPALTIGAGGTLTELLDDAAVRLLPVSDVDIRAAIDETRVATVLRGHRGGRPSNVDALVDLCRAVAHDWGGSLDLNPVLVTPDEAVVVDAAYVPETEV
jgi:acyl-CoA synthetase (NDP forming)